MPTQRADRHRAADQDHRAGKTRLDAADRRARPALGIPTAIRDLIDADDVRVAWNGLSISQQRAILESLQIKVIVKPARGGPGFKPESVSIEWSRQADQRS